MTNHYSTSNKMTVICVIAIILAVLLGGCSPREYEYRFVCDDFTTPWAKSIGINDGTISWGKTVYASRTYYIIPLYHPRGFYLLSSGKELL